MSTLAPSRRLVTGCVLALAACGPRALEAGRDGAATPPTVDAASEPARSPYRALAVTTGTSHTCVLLEDHRVKCWGDNAFGQLGYGDTRPRGADPSEMGDALPTVDLGTGRTATAISAGRYATCAILDDGSLKCWGFSGDLGLPLDPTNRQRGDEPGEMGDALPALDFGPGRTVTRVVVGYYGACAALDDGTVSCWSEVGPSLPKVVSLPTASPVRALGPAHLGALALFDDGTVAQLSSFDPPASPPPALLLAGERAIAVGGAGYTACAILTGGALRCLPAVSVGTFSNVFGPTPPAGPHLVAVGFTEDTVKCGLLEDGGVRCLGTGGENCTADFCDDSTLIDGTVGIKLGQPAAAIATGAAIHTCALLVNGAVRCWGSGSSENSYPALGSSFDPVLTNGKVVGFGPFHDVDLGTRP